MRFLQMLRLRARALTRSDEVDHELRAEMDEHLEQLTAEYVERGLPRAEALEAARREFGPLTRPMEESREARGVAMISTLAQDLGYGIRLMRRTPGFAAAAALTIA